MLADPAESAPLLVRQAEGVLWLTLNRPRARNAINDEVRGLLRHHVREAAAPDVRAVVIRGDERAFSAGADVNEIDGDPGTIARMLEEGRAIVDGIAGLPKPVIAAVRGHAAGSGFSIAMACDIIAADETAVFSSSFTKLGLVPDWSATYWLARQVGLHRAKEIIFSARPVSAGEAHELGLVTRLWPAAQFDAELGRLAHELASGPTPGVRACQAVAQPDVRDRPGHCSGTREPGPAGGGVVRGPPAERRGLQEQDRGGLRRPLTPAVIRWRAPPARPLAPAGDPPRRP